MSTTLYDKNKLTPYLEYAKSVGVTDSYLVLNAIEKAAESFFGKAVYFDEDYYIRFLENDKKISFSKDLVRLIVKNLKNEVVSYKKNNSFNKFSLIGSIINVKIIKYDAKKRKFLAVYRDLDLNCYLDTYDKTTFALEQQVYVYVCQVKQDFLHVKVNKKSILFALQKHYPSLVPASVEKYIPRKILVFTYLLERKITKEEYKSIKALIDVEKIVYIQKGE